MGEMTLTEARQKLEDWTAASRQVAVDRDWIVRRALRAGVQKIEVARITGLARTTIDRIADQAAADVD